MPDDFLTTTTIATTITTIRIITPAPMPTKTPTGKDLTSLEVALPAPNFAVVIPVVVAVLVTVMLAVVLVLVAAVVTVVVVVVVVMVAVLGVEMLI